MTGALADAAIDDCVVVGADAALVEIDLCQFRGWLKRGIIVRGRLSRDTIRDYEKGFYPVSTATRLQVY